MSFKIEDEFQELVSTACKQRIPMMETGIPSMYSKDGKYLYLKTSDLAVGKTEDYFPMVETMFWATAERKVTGTHIPPSYGHKKTYERALDHELLAKWINKHFKKNAGKDLKAAIQSLIG